MEGTLNIQKDTENLPIASFISNERSLTEGQILILKLLQYKITENKPIVLSDIVDIYFEIRSEKDGTIRERVNLTSKWGNVYCKYHDKNSKHAKYMALTWFKQNLGCCIMKGKLLVIPVIEID